MRYGNLKTFSSWPEGSLSPFLSMALQDNVEVGEFVRTEVYKVKLDSIAISIFVEFFFSLTNNLTNDTSSLQNHNWIICLLKN